MSDSLELNGKLIGSIGFDLSLEKIQSIAVNLKDSLYGGAGSVTILSWKGVILADSENAGNVGKKVSEVSDLTVDSFKVNSSIKIGF